MVGLGAKGPEAADNAESESDEDDHMSEPE
jgi:hypothetical protein